MGKAFPGVKFSLVFTKKESLMLVFLVKTMTKVAARLCIVYQVTCSFRVFLGGNYIHSWNKSSCCCFDSPACIQFSCQLSRLV